MATCLLPNVSAFQVNIPPSGQGIAGCEAALRWHL